MGELNVGDELVGLTRAFLPAGTPSVAATLWSVGDRPTGLLMERFYTHLREGMGKAEALRQAQLDVRAEYPNPYFWSAFVLSGDSGAAGEVIPKAKETPASAKGGGGPCPAGALILALGVGAAFITNRRISP